MTGFYVLLGGIVLAAGVFTLLAWLGRGTERRDHHRPVN